MPLQLTPAGVVVPGDRERAELARAWNDDLSVRLPGFLHPQLIRKLHARLGGGASWQVHLQNLTEGQSSELELEDGVTRGLLTALFHDRHLWDAVRGITGCDPIQSFHGRIYRMDPGAHEDVWHTDVNGQYMVALSLNLTAHPFTGGELHLRESGTRRMRVQIANTGQGDAIMFRIEDGLEHIVTSVTGTVPKVAWAGWFHRERLLPELDRLAGLRPAW